MKKNLKSKKRQEVNLKILLKIRVISYSRISPHTMMWGKAGSIINSGHEIYP